MAKKAKTAEVKIASKVEEYTTSLKVQLTIEEVADRADRAAALVADIAAKEADHKAAAKHQKSIIESLQADLCRLSGEVRNRSTYSPCICRREYDYDAGVLRETRMDTGEVLLERALTNDERQPELPFSEDA